MKFIVPLAFFLCLLASCGGSGNAASKSAESNSGQAPSGGNLYQTLDAVSCPNADDFRGAGIGGSENEALAQARSNMALEYFSQKLKSNVQISGQNINEMARSSTKTNIDQEAALANAQDAKMHFSTRKGNQTGVVACMKRDDAAKPYLHKQALLMDSLEFLAANELKATHPKQKGDARDKANVIWARMVTNHELLKSWRIENDITRAKDIHDAVEDDYKDYCQSAKLHWLSEFETPYSEIVFSKLSGSIKVEKSACNGRGILLVFKDSEPECVMKYGLNTCTYGLSISVVACNGTEYLQLKNEAVGAHQKLDFAIDKLLGNLKTAGFWNQWIQEIKQWSPQCE